MAGHITDLDTVDIQLFLLRHILEDYMDTVIDNNKNLLTQNIYEAMCPFRRLSRCCFIQTHRMPSLCAFGVDSNTGA